MTDDRRSFPVLTNFEDDSVLARSLAAEIAECLRKAIRARGQARIVLSGGTTPQKTYLFLSKEDVMWERVEITLADERWVPSSHPRSNHCLLNMTLFEMLENKPRFVPLYRDDVEPADAIKDINAAVGKIVRPFDLVLLGMGNDGHTASLFPQGDQLEQSLDLDDPLLARVINAPGAAEPRVTLTLKALTDARRIILAFSGQKKFETFEKVMAGGPQEDMPIRAVLRHADAPVEVFYSLGDDAAKAADEGKQSLWSELEEHWGRVRDKRITALFEEDQNRFRNFSVEADKFLFDYSKTKLDGGAVMNLVALARESGLVEKRQAMFNGEKINSTEGRAVGHVALRNDTAVPFYIDGQDVMPEVKAVLERMSVFADKVRSGDIVSSSGAKFTDVVNIGIGGSDLGPAMVSQALRPYNDGPAIHYVSNVDGAHITDKLAVLKPETTLVLVASKTFTTIETLTNAKTARKWISDAVGEDNVGTHFAAISSAVDRAQAFGISEDRVFGYRDWVGGRYSVWGPIGLPVMIGIGPERFQEFLAGAQDMDQHFLEQPLEQNIPVLLGLLGIWHNNICGYYTRALLPYDQRLARFAAHIQQVDMESNGKIALLDGGVAERKTGPVVWGEPGTNGQHAFYQLIHQGSQIIPCEFLVACEGHEPDLKEHHDWLVANCLAQSEALMSGRSTEEVKEALIASGMEEDKAAELAVHKTFEGDRPSITIMYPKLDPFTLGRLIALYEHRVFVEGCIWGINSFDQWGVELGKELAKDLYPHVRDRASSETGGSTNSLLDWRAKHL